MKQPLVISFVGVPGSGKTTFARQLAEQIGAITINSDAMRLAIWGSREAIRAVRTTPEERAHSNAMTLGAMNYLVKQSLRAGVSCIFDANGNKVEDRARTAKLAHENGGFAVVVRIRTPHDVALRRMTERTASEDQLEFDHDKALATITSFAAEIEEPDSTEHVVEISGEVPFDEQYAVFSRTVERWTSNTDS